MNEDIQFHKVVEKLSFKHLEEVGDERYEDDKFIIYPTHFYRDSNGMRLDGYTVMFRNFVTQQYESISEPLTYADVQNLKNVKYLG